MKKEKICGNGDPDAVLHLHAVGKDSACRSA